MCNSSDPFGLLTPAQLAQLWKAVALAYAGASSILEGAHKEVPQPLRPVMEWAKAIDPEKIKTSKDLAQAATDEARLLSSGPAAKVAPAITDATAAGAAELSGAEVLSLRIAGGTAVGGPVGAAIAIVYTIAVSSSDLNSDETSAAWKKAHPHPPKKDP